MFRPIVDVVDGAVLHDATAVHHTDVVCHVSDHAEIMGDDDERRPCLALQVTHEFGDLRLDRDIQSRRRLIRDEQARGVDERHGNHDPLPHAPRQLVRIVINPLAGRGDPHVAESVDRTRPRFLGAHLVVHPHGFLELVTDAVEGVQAGERILENHGHHGAPELADLVIIEGQQIGAIQNDATADMSEAPIEKPHDRLSGDTLARSGLAHDGEGAPLTDRKRRAGDGLDHPVLGGE